MNVGTGGSAGTVVAHRKVADGYEGARDYLNTCHRMSTCRYVHWILEDPAACTAPIPITPTHFSMRSECANEMNVGTGGSAGTVVAHRKVADGYEGATRAIACRPAVTFIGFSKTRQPVQRRYRSLRLQHLQTHCGGSACDARNQFQSSCFQLTRALRTHLCHRQISHVDLPLRSLDSRRPGSLYSADTDHSDSSTCSLRCDVKVAEVGVDPLRRKRLRRTESVSVLLLSADAFIGFSKTRQPVQRRYRSLRLQHLQSPICR
jgi:hypothetical protein